MNLAFLNRMNARERRLATILLGLLAVGIGVILPIYLEWTLIRRRSEIDDLRTALEAVQGARSQIRERRDKKDAILARYQKRAPALASFLDQAARAQKLEVVDTSERPDVPIGTSKRYVERSTLIHFKKSGMRPLAEFLSGLERTDYPITISRLDLRRRLAEPDSYDVEVIVSAFDRSPDAPVKADAKGESEKGGK